MNADTTRPASADALDWRPLLVWALVLGLSCLTQSYVMVVDEARHGHVLSFGHAFAVEASSHLMIAALAPAVYWMQRHFPLSQPRNFLLHALAIVPFSLVHTTGMAALRLLWFSAIWGESFRFPLTFERLSYEFSKDIFTYCLMIAAIMAFRHWRERAGGRPAMAPPAPSLPEAPASAARPERFAVRKRGGAEVVVAVADIDWIEASGNYAILHVAGETFEIRSSLAKLEAELDPKQFVRVHKSHLVNITRVSQVTPWVNGDWRIRLRDGAEVNLSRRYRQRFEALAPVRT
ncbi:transcriptional regulator, LytTR family [Enhydrobacter aerosaccus]|uniref:Transcriptional regulator, LytTR family n=1 Tax=Enhydrobacter aerosaccus TaxID=225324 RepID=A0A1T4PGV7_9HYPH|nr:LytTR family DNA-binding domain-containing protein [Enhydrobacter aerosaccus]SJZ90793.1 transcriptional regulator, LytTR family [Enhydrobacter aerosaccus]